MGKFKNKLKEIVSLNSEKLFGFPPDKKNKGGKPNFKNIKNIIKIEDRLK